ncbi:putative flagellin FlaG [Treponema primitia ZAS-2]|uniref:Putative flagellin FlaG n=1 Tax=Treponema primitia (strain ATCC BAA-887 / DSM 12427 / ZAS-2) TaxID=545694 RepID=F5YKK4_TREPZ|nr:flagellar protein FlaG [Treponema primitia]AEF86680.1 putative flagellin FlaG [Treponema primitia ZAS-2]
MGTVIAAVGVKPQQELPQDRGFAKQTRILAAAKTAALEKFEASLPGNRNPSEKVPLDIGPTVADLERVTLALNRRLKFEVDHQSHEVIVKVIDGETDKVIKVLPPEELQRLHDNIKETIGFLFDEKV